MVSHERQVEYYQTVDGKVPFLEWFDSLRDRKTQQRIDGRLAHVRAGNLGACRSVGEGVTELVFNFGPGYRVYIGQKGNHLVLLLCGGDKSTQRSDILTARNYWADYRKRYG
ncbi:MAG: type II toxin-antitoxin system RelE/ParE family toxin [Candidatus Binatia bacterium]